MYQITRACQPNHEQQPHYHHVPKVKPKAATAVVELLMMGLKTPETCWAVNKRLDNKLEKLLHLVGDLFELYHDVRTYKLQTQYIVFKWRYFESGCAGTTHNT
jgi:hypothetical protein